MESRVRITKSGESRTRIMSLTITENDVGEVQTENYEQECCDILRSSLTDKATQVVFPELLNHEKADNGSISLQTMVDDFERLCAPGMFAKTKTDNVNVLRACALRARR